MKLILISFLIVANLSSAFAASEDSGSLDLSDFSNELNELDASSRGAIAFRSGNSDYGISLGYSRLVLPAIQVTTNLNFDVNTVKSTSSGLTNTTTTVSVYLGPTFNFPVEEGIGEAFFILPQLYFLSVNDRAPASTFGASLTAGKRFALNEVVSYAPYLSFSKRFNATDFNTDIRTVISPLAFSFFF